MTDQNFNGDGLNHRNWNQPQPLQYGYQQQPTANRDAGFFSALFDFSFQKYATPSIVKVIYILVAVLLGIGAVIWGGVLLFAVIDSVQWGAGIEALAFLVAIPVLLLFLLLQLALFRVMLEAGLALVRAAQSLKDLEQR